MTNQSSTFHYYTTQIFQECFWVPWSSQWELTPQYAREIHIASFLRAPPIYTRDIHAELNSFLVLLISEVRNTAITGKLRTFWECNKYQGGYFNSCHFTQKPNVVGIIKTSFLKALNTEVNSKQGSRIWGNGKWMKQTFFFNWKGKIPRKGKSYCQISAKQE